MQGLTTEEAYIRLNKFGFNELPQTKSPSSFTLFVHQFKNPLIYILIAAALISLGLNQMSDAFFIFVVLILNAIIGTIQEFSAQKSASSLQKMVPACAKIMRNGNIINIDAKEIVPGDIILLESGDKVPADIKLLSSINLSIDESLLTGESVAINKDSNATIKNDAPVSEQFNMAFAGTMVVRGRGEGEVIATATNTEIGKIAGTVTKNLTIKPPLLHRIEAFTLKIMYAVLAMVFVLFIISYMQGEDIADMFLIAVALAVSAIPEGLPVAITIALSIGMRRMADKNVIVRKLLAVESLGSCTFIASDKTGTLTVNELTVRKIILPDNAIYNLTGEGISPKGNITQHATETPNLLAIKELITTAVLANEARLYQQAPPQDWKAEGDMVDVALLVAGKKCGINREDLILETPQIACMPYESDLGYSASVHSEQNQPTCFVKGAPEKILSMCTKMAATNGYNPIDTSQVTKQMHKLAEDGYRVLAFAKGDVSSDIQSDILPEQIQNLTFLGFVGMIDPLRPEAKDAVDLCKQAGIEVAMITGDHPLTARSIAMELGLGGDNPIVVVGSDIKQAQGVTELIDLIKDCRIFARIEPMQKKEIVDILTRTGHFVAVTGDGVNDAPALKQAHVGVAMGERGTDVARESADLILINDDFSSIVQGVTEGRVVYNNIRKVIYLLISTGAAEIIMFLLAMILGLPMPLMAVQLLWLNLVTNGIQDVALAFEPAEGNELKYKPRNPKEPIFDALMLKRVLLSAVLMGGIAFTVYYWLLELGYTVESARNYVLLLMVMLENMHALNSRSETRSIFKQKFFSNPLLIVSIIAAQFIHIICMYIPGISDVLHIQPVSLNEWLALLLVACSLLVADEILALCSRLHNVIKNVQI